MTEQLRLVFIAAADAQASATGGDTESVVAKRKPERPAALCWALPGAYFDSLGLPYIEPQ